MLFGKPKVVDAVSRPGVKFNRFSKMTIGSRLALLLSRCWSSWPSPRR